MNDPTPDVLATMVTTTTYGSWLPGDLRGYVDDGMILPGDPRKLEQARRNIIGDPVLLRPNQIVVLDWAIGKACAEFGYTLTDLSIESWHLHWIVSHGFDRVDVMVGRLKTRMRQALGRGRIWTEGYCHRCLYSPDEIGAAGGYIGRHAGARIVASRRISPQTPGGAGG